MEEKVKAWIDDYLKKRKELIASAEFVCEDETHANGVIEHIRKDELHVYDIIQLSKDLGIELQICEWDGNKTCNSNWLEGSFVYDGVKLFELLSKKEVEEYERNERAE